jgi:hypothetical protein
MKLQPYWTGLAAAGLLAACGGGGGQIVDERVVPASATVSPAAYTAFVGAQPVEDDEEPLAVGELLPPTSDVDEPAPLR